MYRAINPHANEGEAGFTILEVLIALAVVAIVVVAIGSVMSTNARGVRLMESHAAMIETAQAVLADAVPGHNEIAPENLAGQSGLFRWRIKIDPYTGGLPGTDVKWIPERVRVRVQSPSGAAIDLETIRLMRARKDD